MATFTAGKAGNWSDTTVWGLQGVPQSGDTADLAGHVVTLDVEPTGSPSGTIEILDSRYDSITNSSGCLLASNSSLQILGTLNVSQGILKITGGLFFFTKLNLSSEGNVYITSTGQLVIQSRGLFTTISGSGFVIDLGGIFEPIQGTQLGKYIASNNILSTAGGNYVLPATNKVLTGTTYGVSNGTTGTLVALTDATIIADLNALMNPAGTGAKSVIVTCELSNGQKLNGVLTTLWLDNAMTQQIGAAQISDINGNTYWLLTNGQSYYVKFILSGITFSNPYGPYNA